MTPALLESTPGCACESCVSACERMPGWLSPNDVRRLAVFRGLDDPRALFRDTLAFDYWVGCPLHAYGSGCECAYEDVWVAAPATDGLAAGDLASFGYRFSPNYRCNQLTNNDRCAIHEAKPRECAWVRCCVPTTEQERQKPYHRTIARAWARPTGLQFMAFLRTPVLGGAAR